MMTFPDLNNKKSFRGFTLPEVLIVLIIIGVLVAIAYPSYLEQILKSKRTVAKSALLDIANREEQYFFSNRAYTNNLTNFGFNNPTYFSEEHATTTTSGKAVYQVTAAITGCGTAPCFILTATPKNNQVDDACGTFTLRSDNAKQPDPATSDCW